jgi:hypothetical protein
MPVARFASSFISSEGCSSSCHEASGNKDADGCPKEMCSPFSCCLKTFILFQHSYCGVQQPVHAANIQNNFTLKQILLSFKDFDIWNPPKFV